MKNGASVSKKWKQAVRDGIFTGTFSEFAKVYNEIGAESETAMTDVFPEGGEDDFSSDNAIATNLGSASDTTKITQEDKKPLNEQAPKEVFILGMKPKTFYIVSGVTAIAVVAGLYFFVSRVGGEKTKD